MLHDRCVVDLLHSSSLQQWESLLQEEELRMFDLSTMTFQELRAALPTMPSGRSCVCSALPEKSNQNLKDMALSEKSYPRGDAAPDEAAALAQLKRACSMSTPSFLNTLIPYVPSTRAKTKTGFFRRRPLRPLCLLTRTFRFLPLQVSPWPAKNPYSRDRCRSPLSVHCVAALNVMQSGLGSSVAF